MLLTRFDPFKSFNDMGRDFFDYPLTKNEGLGGFVPVVNTREGEFAYHIDIDLPGVQKDDIKIDISKGVLTISGERRTKEEVKEDDYYKVETSFGKFTRSFTLPDNIDTENIEASSSDGVLEVVIPKQDNLVDKKTIVIK